jgi:hypothetical protein
MAIYRISLGLLTQDGKTEKIFRIRDKMMIMGRIYSSNEKSWSL